MAKADKNKFVASLRGSLGGLVIRQMPDGTVIVSTAPHYRGKKRKSSKKQKEHQSRFKIATVYARRAAKAHPIYAELARGTVKSPYNFALSDWWHAPVIQRLEQREGRILVEATDNVMVAKVRITVLGGEGQVLETGDATRAEGDCWEYACHTQGKRIQASAWDLAGNETKFIQQLDY